MPYPGEYLQRAQIRAAGFFIGVDVNPALSQDDLDALDPAWVAEMLRIAAEGGQPPQLPPRPEATHLMPSRDLRRREH